MYKKLAESEPGKKERVPRSASKWQGNSTDNQLFPALPTMLANTRQEPSSGSSAQTRGKDDLGIPLKNAQNHMVYLISHLKNLSL